MENIKITDIHSEMEEIGRELFQNKQHIYTEKLQNEIYAVIEKVYPAATPEEKDGIFYRSIYDYWVYGCNINEELFYHFAEKTHKEKCEYITVKNRFPYMHHINKKEDAHLLNDKYEAYQILKPYFKRDMIEISGERFEYETNMLLECKQADISIVEQTIETVYINDNETTHFHPIKDSLRVYGIIIKFFISSLLSFVIDQILNVLGYNVLFKLFAEGARQFCAGTLARILSSLFNFTMNRKAVFRSDAPLRLTICRYYVLWVCQLLASVGSVFLLSKLLPVKPTIIKPFVDFLLYFISFRVQQAWVFKPASSKDAGADESTNA